MSEPEVWHVLIQNGETVSLLKNLTAALCRQAVQHLRPQANPWEADLTQKRARWDADADGYRAEMKAQNDSQSKFLQQMQSSNGLHHFGLQQHYFCKLDWEEPNLTQHYTDVQWWGPDGEELEIWPEPPDYKARYDAAVTAIRQAAEINRKIDEKANGHR